MLNLLPETYRILLIEDNKDHVVLVQRLLESSELDVRLDVMGTVVEAMVAMKDNRYHVVISDLGLPDCTGTASIGAIKKKFPEVALIVLTSNSERWLEEEALKCGAHDLLLKSDVSQKLLSHAIRRAIFRQVVFDRSQHESKSKVEITVEALRSVETLFREIESIDPEGSDSGELRKRLDSVKDGLSGLAEMLQGKQ